MRAVFDTNVVVSALVFGKRLAWLRHAWTVGVLVPVVCRPTAEELLRVLAYPKFRLDPAEQQVLLEGYLPYAEISHLPVPMPPLPVACRDRDDAVFLQLALAAEVNVLVSGDRDLAVLRDVLRPILVMSAAELRTVLGEGQA
jgi:uncharacterized protein